MKTVKVLDKEFGLYIPQAKIEANIQNVADQINRDLEGMNPLFLVVLNGAFMFASELFKRLTIPCEISFVKLSSYAGTETTNVVRELIGLDHPLNGRHVVIVEDIVDTGHTLRYTTQKLRDLKAADVRIASNTPTPSTTKAWTSATSSSWDMDWIMTNRGEICRIFIKSLSRKLKAVSHKLPPTPRQAYGLRLKAYS